MENKIKHMDIFGNIFQNQFNRILSSKITKQMNQLTFKQLTVDQDNKLCSINGEAIALSKKEYELLVFLMLHPNYVHSRESLLKELWDNSVSLRTVDTTVSRLRKKLQEYGAYITTRLGFGYSFNNSD